MRNRKGIAHGKIVIGLLAVIFIAYGYYGYMYVPSQSSFGSGQGGAFCPFGRAEGLLQAPQTGGFGASTGSCAFSLLSLIIGIVIIIGLIAFHHFKK